jgi:hypothetical protein
MAQWGKDVKQIGLNSADGDRIYIQIAAFVFILLQLLEQLIISIWQQLSFLFNLLCINSHTPMIHFSSTPVLQHSNNVRTAGAVINPTDPGKMNSNLEGV